MIAELFLDGRPLFTLSQLLEYCNGDREAFEITLKKINDKLIRVSGDNFIVNLFFLNVLYNSGPSLIQTPLIQNLANPNHMILMAIFGMH